MIAPGVFIALAVIAYALLSKALASTPLTAPIFFAAVGLIAGPMLGFVEVPVGDEAVVLLLEAALVMVLFADAGSLDLRRWTREPGLSTRLLGIGLPLTMVAGAMAAAAILPGIEPWQAALIGVMLAPTDAALGQAVVANPRVPAVIRNALNVESGLNDGLALPFVSIFIAIGLASTGAESEVQAIETLIFGIGASTLIGIAVGALGGWLLRASVTRGMAATAWQAIALVAVALAAFVISDSIEASGFLSAWVAGLVTGTIVRRALADEAFHLPEQLADVLTAVGFLLLGLALLGPVLTRLTPTAILYAVISLTVVRIVPVAIAMWRAGYARPSILYVGWFGPRGLASIVFGGVVVEEAVPGAAAVTDVVLVTVALSIVAHGLTAAWGARRYAAWFEEAVALDPSIAEAATLEGKAVYRRRTPRGGVHG